MFGYLKAEMGSVAFSSLRIIWVGMLVPRRGIQFTVGAGIILEWKLVMLSRARLG